MKVPKAIGANGKKAVNTIDKVLLNFFRYSTLAISTNQEVSVSVIKVIGLSVRKCNIKVHSLDFYIFELI
jgi:hypothetical protein